MTSKTCSEFFRVEYQKNRMLEHAYCLEIWIVRIAIIDPSKRSANTQQCVCEVFGSQIICQRTHTASTPSCLQLYEEKMA